MSRKLGKSFTQIIAERRLAEEQKGNTLVSTTQTDRFSNGLEVTYAKEISKGVTTESIVTTMLSKVPQSTTNGQTVKFDLKLTAGSLEHKFNYREISHPEDHHVLSSGNLCWWQVVLGVRRVLGRDIDPLYEYIKHLVNSENGFQKLGDQISLDSLDKILGVLNVRIKVDRFIFRQNDDLLVGQNYVLGVHGGEWVEGYTVKMSTWGTGNNCGGHYILVKE